MTTTISFTLAALALIGTAGTAWFTKWTHHNYTKRDHAYHRGALIPFIVISYIMMTGLLTIAISLITIGIGTL